MPDLPEMGYIKYPNKVILDAVRLLLYDVGVRKEKEIAALTDELTADIMAYRGFLYWRKVFGKMRTREQAEPHAKVYEGEGSTTPREHIMYRGSAWISDFKDIEKVADVDPNGTLWLSISHARFLSSYIKV